MSMSRVGVWGPGTWLAPDRRGELLAFAGEIEALGFASLWMSAGFDEGVPAAFGEVLDGTSTLQVATGILSIWHSSAAQTAAVSATLEARHPGRFIAGLGASHERFVTQLNRDYTRPYSATVAYLDELDALGNPPERRMLAALGPKMLTLAVERSAGAHPYLVPVEYTAEARGIVGSGGRLVTEVTVALETDAARARSLARGFLSLYLELPAYTGNLERLGFSADDIAGGGSDRLVDALVGWGDGEAVVRRVREHLDAGSDEVLVQVLHDGPSLPTDELRVIAEALGAA